jgi:copper chaperone NosL
MNIQIPVPGDGCRWRRLLSMLIMALVALSALAGCSQVDLDAPPEMNYGMDICDQCGMSIDEARFAASYVTESGETRRFESVSDMFAYDLEHDEAVYRYWVHDFETEEWVRGDEAFYILSDNIITPMGVGLVAAATPERAEAIAAEWNGTVLSFDNVMTLAEGGHLEPGHAMGH